MVGPQMCEKNRTKSESERGKCQKRVLRGGRKINSRIISSARSRVAHPFKREWRRNGVAARWLLWLLCSLGLPPILMSATQITRLLELTFIQRHNSPLKGKSEYVWGSGFCGLAWCSNHLSVYPAVHVSYSFLFAHHRYERLLGKYICTSVHVYQRTFLPTEKWRVLIEERQGYWLMIHSWKTMPDFTFSTT